MTTMLVDGKNSAYRAVYACLRDRSGGSDDPVIAALRFMSGWLEQFDPSEVIVCWDSDSDSLWRKASFSGYKIREQREQIVVDMVGRFISTMTDLLPHLGVKQIRIKHMEADDLIYAAVRLLIPRDIVIVSSDSDFRQLLAYRNVTIYSPIEKKLIVDQDGNACLYKALVGDDTDTIPGYHGIGPVKGGQIANDPARLAALLDERGVHTFVRNLYLMDLTQCPNVIANLITLARALARPVQFNSVAALDVANEHKVSGFVTDSGRLLRRFQELETRHGNRNSRRQSAPNVG